MKFWNRSKPMMEKTEQPAPQTQSTVVVEPDTVKSIEASESTTEIPEHVFIEYEKPKPPARMEPTDEQTEVYDLTALYKFLEQSFEKKGYEDALMNPDTSSMEEQIVLLQNSLTLMLSKVKTYYSAYMRNIEFHIETRKRNGMIETVDELQTHRKNIEEEITIVQSIAEEARQGAGLGQTMILSYKRGFRNGFAAITYNNVLSRKN